MKYSTEYIEKIIYAYLPEETGYAKPVLEAMNYAFRAGGKRLRPMLMKLCYDLFDGGVDESVLAAFMASIEMIHTYSLIHDDLPALDNDDLRRGKPTVHVKFGEDLAILAGDGLLNYAFETAVGAFRLYPGNIAIERAFMLLCQKPGIDGMIGGQVLDVVLTGKPVNDKELEYIYLNKTAALLSCAMTIGATLGGANESQIACLHEAAICIGMAFQVQDDILDVVGDAQMLGKPIKSDERNEKTTYVSLYGLEAAKKFVEEQTLQAERMIGCLDVRDQAAKNDLLALIHTLIDRDK
ncbi:MAG: polyprenyl synthetase family protein [Eubacteriales bacterium]|nr:polyprenyl synthetase family protein [Lachnospiraceae bacterium]MDO5126544.1 polyprenyl synthetase family protein [Eubacteriales bacterium]